MKRDRLYTITAGNKNLFLGGGQSNVAKFDRLASSYFGADYGDPGHTLGDYMNSKNLFGISKVNNPLSKGNIGGTLTAAAPAIGGAVAMLIGGPLAWLIGGGAMLAKWLFGEEKTEEEKQAEAMNRLLNEKEREQVFESIKEEYPSICDSVATSIRNALTSEKNIQNSIDKISWEFMQAYKDGLKSARILVD